MPPPKPEHTKEALVAAAQATAARLGTERLTIGRFCAETGINPARVYARFTDWPALCAAAGLAPGDKPADVETAHMLADLHAAIMDAGAIEPQRRLLRRVAWSNATLVRRFGDWGGALRALRDWAADNAADFPYAEPLDARIKAQARRRAWRGPAPAERPDAPPWKALGGRLCGPPLAFRAMVRAPVNEAGVILLFGMVAGELGYAVDSLGAAFPDCAAKRLVATGPRGSDARWEPVRIEFEFRSRNFLYHGHDPAACEVIVCWEHDWPDCPLEVLALRDVVAALQG